MQLVLVGSGRERSGRWTRPRAPPPPRGDVGRLLGIVGELGDLGGVRLFERGGLEHLELVGLGIVERLLWLGRRNRRPLYQRQPVPGRHRRRRHVHDELA
jgi:hypothetical protein